MEYMCGFKKKMSSLLEQTPLGGKRFFRLRILACVHHKSTDLNRFRPKKPAYDFCRILQAFLKRCTGVHLRA
ncbi:hypothetical protein DND90_09495 [Pseudomonas syringae pv. maculicola]|nr:hypothetical protein DND90_09495 [Pseudomonas syringae pv. maculicola]